MKFLLLVLAASVALAADSPKPTPLPDKDQAAITKAQNAVLRLDSSMKQMQLQYREAETALKSAQVELMAAVEAAKKTHGCASISEALECIPPTPPAPKEAKPEAKPEKR